MNTYYVTGHWISGHPDDPYGDKHMFERTPESHFIQAESADEAVELVRSVGLRVNNPEDVYCVRCEV